MSLINGRLPWVAAFACLGFLFVATVTTADQPAAPERTIPAEQAVVLQSTFNDNCVCNECEPPIDDEVPCDDHTPSLGSFNIKVRHCLVPLMTGYRPYNPADPDKGGWYLPSETLYSPTLYDDHTIIGRSAPHLDSDDPSSTDKQGTPVGSDGIGIKDGDFTFVPPGFEELPEETREVHTKLSYLNMTDQHGYGVVLQAGDWEPLNLGLSPGEVESKNEATGDFPAKSFFNVFVEAYIPASGTFPGGWVYNKRDHPKDPLVITNDNLNRFPPRVIYIHGETDRVPVRFRDNYPPDGPPYVWRAGQVFGHLVLAGHGVGPEVEVCGEVGCYWGDCTEEVKTVVCAEDMPESPRAVPCLFPDGCHEYLEPKVCTDSGGNPIPAVTEWGLVVMLLLVLAAGTIVIRRRRAAVA